MRSEEVTKIEETFRNSRSSDELFDAFQSAMKIKLTDLDIFKILIANPTLSPGEIKMFTEKLIKEIPGKAHDLLLWTGKVLENHPNNYTHLEDTILIYRRAIAHNPSSHESLLKLLNLYNHELDLPTNHKILSVVEESIASVDRKSKVYYELAKHYRKLGNVEMEKNYLRRAEESSKTERG